MGFTLEQVVTRENRFLDVAGAALEVGLDGRVYLVSYGAVVPGLNHNYILGVGLDGSGRKAVEYQQGVEIPVGVTANRNGTLARADAHFSGAITVLGPDLQPIGQVTRCWTENGSATSPVRVLAGASGRFYGLAPAGLTAPGGGARQTTAPTVIVVGSPPDPVVELATIELPFATGSVRDFRVVETSDFTPVFYVLYQDSGQNHLAKVDHTGALVWTRTDPHIQIIFPRMAGGFDVDANGLLYVAETQGARLLRYPDDGVTAPTELPFSGNFPSPVPEPYRELRIFGNQAVLPRRQSRDLFDVFTLPAPTAPDQHVAFVRSVPAEHDLVQASFNIGAQGDTPWPAGGTVPVTLTIDRFSGGGLAGRLAQPDWRAWIRSIGAQDHRELPITPVAGDPWGFQISVPADVTGLRQLTLAPVTAPWRTGVTPEYRVRCPVEIRPAGVTGSVSIGTNTPAVQTPANQVTSMRANRTRYACGDAISVGISVRQNTAAEHNLALRLDDVATTPPVTVARTMVAMPHQANWDTTITVPGAVTSQLRPGRYLLTIDEPGLTTAAQPIDLGSGQPPSDYRRVWFGDLAVLFPVKEIFPNTPFAADRLDAADVAEAHLERVRRQGWTIATDRLGAGLASNLAIDPVANDPLLALVQPRLDADPIAVDSRKLLSLAPLLEVVAGFGGLGVQQRAMLVFNDTSVPLPRLITPDPTNAEPRRALDRYVDMLTVHQVCAGYRGFGGWQWAGNWWLVEDGALLGTPDSIAARAEPTGVGPLHTAIQRCLADGHWVPLLGAVAGHAQAIMPNTQRQLRRALVNATGSNLATAAPPPFRAAGIYPPFSFADVDEVDMQAQLEQFSLILHTAFMTDFYSRPDKRSTLHEENYNDSGAGDQLLGQALESLLRGSDTSGHSGWVPIFRAPNADPRDNSTGAASMVRVLSELLHELGAWIGGHDNADRVAILLSSRQFALESWGNVMPTHFGPVFEAWLSLLYAQLPADIVFVDDLDTAVRPLTDYAAVLLVNERIDLDDQTRNALAQARNAGVAVFHDDSCRPEVVAAVGSTPLKVPFDRCNDPSFVQGNADAVYPSWIRTVRDHVPAVQAALAGVVGPRATADDPQVLVSERRRGDSRIVLAVNNSVFDVDPAFFRRADNFTGVRAPLTAHVTIPSPSVVYDVLAGQQVTPDSQGRFTADFRHWPIAIFAVLPAAITGVAVNAALVDASIHWTAQVTGATTVLPVRIRILDEDNSVLWQQNTVTPAEGRFPVPANARGRLRVEAVDLVSGQADSAVASGNPASGQLDLATGTGITTTPVTFTKAPVSDTGWRPAAARLGPHLRGIALTDDGGAVLSAANWDANLYAVDLATGQPRWQRRIGQQFTFGAQGVTGAVAVRSMALDAASGYGLCLVRASDGSGQRRFDLHGTTPRWFGRLNSCLTDGRPPAFALPPSGNWVATAGNLGMAVWRTFTGDLVWRLDWWQQAPLTEPPGISSEALLIAVDEDTLLTVTRDTVTCRRVSTNSPDPLWTTDLAALATTIGGRATAAAVSPDGTMLALATTYDGGRLTVLRTANGAVVSTVSAVVDEVAWSADSTTVVTLHDTQVRLYVDPGPAAMVGRSYPAGDVLHGLTVAPDGRIACGDEQGNLIVLDANANPITVLDLGGLPVPRWLPGGDLLAATWLGRVTRLDGTTFQPKWNTQLRSAAPDMRAGLLAPEPAPITRISGAGNGSAPPNPLPANVLSPATTTISFFGSGGSQTFLDATKLLAANPTPPLAPLLTDEVIEPTAFDHTPVPYLSIMVTQPVTFARLTLFDDPAHPESWLRDLRLDVRTGPNSWRPITRLIADAAARTYALPGGAVTATEIRLVVPQGLAGNLRLAGIALHA